MADRTALTAGIAAASIAAVVAATPALITPPNNDVQITASADAALAKRTVTANVQLAAFTLQGFLTAFADGYLDDTYTGDVFGDQASQAGVEGAIYYTLDNLLPASFDYDDHAFAVFNPDAGLDLSNVYYHLAVDLGVDEDLAFDFVSFLIDPFNTSLALAGLPPELIDFINDPITELVNTVGGPLGPLVNDFINDPISTVINAVGGDLGPLVNDFINDPISTVINAVGGDLGPLVNAFINDPIGTTAFILGEDVYNFVVSPVQAVARIVAELLGAQQNISTLGLKSGSDETVGITTTEAKAPTFVNVKLPTPAEAVSEIKANVDSAVKDFTAAITPKKLDKVEVQTLVGDDEVDEDAPKKEKFGKLKVNFDGPVADLAKGVSKSLKDAADKHDEKRAEKIANVKEKRAERVASFKKKLGGSDDSGE